MSDVIFEEIECKSAINRVKAPGWPFRWTLNPYRGCQHACVYCSARGTHEFLGYDAGRDFERRVIVKRNLAAALRQDLSRPSWRRELIAVGTACDPYQQAEMKYGLTEAALRVLVDFANPIGVVTKSPQVVRDIDLLARLSQSAAVSVSFSVGTLDDDVWRRCEPGTAKPIKRIEAMGRLAARGIRAGVLLAPIIPGLTDSRASLEEVVRAATDHGASYLGSNVLYLRPGTKEWFMPFLREAYPHLSERYARYYRGAYAPSTYTRDVLQVVAELKERWGLADREAAPSAPRGQMRLALA